jgi:hypothetical protein
MQPSMVIVEILLGSMVSVVGKLVHLEQKRQVSKATQLQFWRILGVSEIAD